MGEHTKGDVEFAFPSTKRRLAVLIAAAAALAALPLVLPPVRRMASSVHMAWKYPKARDVATRFAAAAATRDTFWIRRLALSRSDSSTRCARAAWPQATWQFGRPRPRVTFDGVVGDYLFFTTHSVAERDGRHPVGLRMGIARDAPQRVAVISPIPPLADLRGC